MPASKTRPQLNQSELITIYFAIHNHFHPKIAIAVRTIAFAIIGGAVHCIALQWDGPMSRFLTGTYFRSWRNQITGF
jgi:hypothetical protein